MDVRFSKRTKCVSEEPHSYIKKDQMALKDKAKSTVYKAQPYKEEIQQNLKLIQKCKIEALAKHGKVHDLE